jgi:hypothetical protein
MIAPCRRTTAIFLLAFGSAFQSNIPSTQNKPTWTLLSASKCTTPVAEVFVCNRARKRSER